jgi:hypothetical protein
MSALHAPLLVLAALAVAGVAQAEPAVTADAAGPIQVDGAHAAALFGRTVDESALADLSGGQETAVAITDQTLNAVNGGNTVKAGGDINNGAVSLSANAFSGFAGIGNFVINTGNNNNLQGSLSVTIVMAPGL